MRDDLLDIFFHSVRPEDRRRDLLISGAAMLVAAVVLGLVARWLLLGGLSEGLWALNEREFGRKTQRAETLTWLTMGGSGAGFVSLVLAMVGLYSVAAALSKR